MAPIWQIYLDAATVTAGLLHDPAVAAHWDDDSALAHYRVSGLLPTTPARTMPLGRSLLRLDDLLTSRLLELTVHNDDLAVSIGVPTPPAPRGALDATLTLLTQLAVTRHGPLAVLRALSRAERAPTTITAL